MAPYSQVDPFPLPYLVGYQIDYGPFIIRKRIIHRLFFLIKHLNLAICSCVPKTTTMEAKQRF